MCVGCFHIPTVSEAPSKLMDQVKAAKAGQLPGLTVDPVTGIEGRNVAASFAEGKQAAKQDFNRTVSWATGIALWILIPLSIIVLIASFFVAWIPTRSSVWCAVAAACVAGGRYALLVYGTIAVDIAVYISIATAVLVGLFVGLPLVFSWVNRRIHKKGEAMSDPAQAAAIIATVNPDVAKNPSAAAGLIQIARSGVDDIATKARAELKSLGVTA